MFHVDFLSGKWFIEFQLTLHKSDLNAVRLVLCITLLWIVNFLFSLWIFDEEVREWSGKWSDTSLLMIAFLSSNDVAKENLWIYYQLPKLLLMLL